MDEHYDDLKHKQMVSSHIKTSYMKFRKFYDTHDEELVEKLKKECELVLLNNR